MVALLWWWRGGMVVITSKREEERRFLFFSGNRHKLFFSLVFSFHSFSVMLFLLSFSSFFHSLLSSPSSFSSSSFFVVPVTYWWWGVYIGARGACATLPLSNNAERVGWLGGQCAVARKASPLCPFHHNGRPWEGHGLCRGFRHEREREREALQRRERKPSYPATTHVKGEKMANSAIKMALFCSIVFFFIIVN